MALLYPRNDSELDQSFSGRKGKQSDLNILYVDVQVKRMCQWTVTECEKKLEEWSCHQLKCGAKEIGFRGKSEVQFGVSLRYVLDI